MTQRLQYTTGGDRADGVAGDFAVVFLDES